MFWFNYRYLHESWEKRVELKVQNAILGLTPEKLIAACGPPRIDHTISLPNEPDVPIRSIYYPDNSPRTMRGTDEIVDSRYPEPHFRFEFRRGKLSIIDDYIWAVDPRWVPADDWAQQRKAILGLLELMPCLKATRPE